MLNIFSFGVEESHIWVSIEPFLEEEREHEIQFWHFFHIPEAGACARLV